MQEQLIRQEQHVQFHRFDIVWSKLTGYPWWPGKIIEIPKQKSGKYKVQFIGDNTHAFLPANKLIPYLEGHDKFSTPQKMFKGFNAARCEADLLATSRPKETEGARGDYSQPKTVPDQQIQIFNQEVRINNSAQTPLHQSQQKIQETNEPKTAKNTQTKSPQHLMTSIRRPVAIYKKKQIEKHEKLVKQLLIKYQLDRIPPVEESRQSGRRIIKRKRKIIIRRKPIEISNTDIQISLIKKINAILRKKNNTDVLLNRQIAVYLGKSLMAKRKDGAKGAYRALFQWLSNNDYHMIGNSYRSWQCNGDKLVTGFTESNSVPDMKQDDEQ